jgi:hypothetical protein
MSEASTEEENATFYQQNLLWPRMSYGKNILQICMCYGMETEFINII